MVKYVKENPVAYRSKTMFINALIELMHEKPYSKISIKELCQRADLVRQTFYHNFNSMDDIVIEYILRREKGRIQYFYHMEYEPYEIYRRFFQSWKKDEIVLSLIIQNKLVDILHRTYYNLLTNTPSNDIKKTEKLETPEKYAMSLFVGGLVAVLHYWSETGMKETPEEMSFYMCELQNSKARFDPSFRLNK